MYYNFFEKVFLFFDLTVVLVYLLMVYKKGFGLVVSILVISLIIIVIFLMYKLINYIEKNNEKILNKMKKYISVEKQKKIRKFFIKPIVCKLIYYGVWLLPWNVGYWVYFWIMEYGWYARVWITSTRDIILWRLFKWDSRDFFYKLYGKMRKNFLFNIKKYSTV